MYHLAGLVFHWTTRLRQNVWAGIRIGVAVLVYGSSVGSYMQFVLRVQHAVAHALGVVRITWALWKETKGQSRDDIRRVHRGEALPTFHPHLFWLASAIVILMAKHFYQRPWDYKDREGKRNQWWQKRSCSLFCHSKKFFKKIILPLILGSTCLGIFPSLLTWPQQNCPFYATKWASWFVMLISAGQVPKQCLRLVQVFLPPIGTVKFTHFSMLVQQFNHLQKRHFLRAKAHVLPRIASKPSSALVGTAIRNSREANSASPHLDSAHFRRLLPVTRACLAMFS